MSPANRSFCFPFVLFSTLLTGFPVKRAKTRVPPGVDLSGFDSLADNTSGLLVVPAIAEAALADKLPELAETVFKFAARQVVQAEFL